MSGNLLKWSALMSVCEEVSLGLRVNGCPVAVDCSGVVRASARLRNSDEVFAL